MTKPLKTIPLRLRSDQLDLIAIMAAHVRDWNSNPQPQETAGQVIARKFTRKQSVELLNDIIHVYPEAGK